MAGDFEQDGLGDETSIQPSEQAAVAILNAQQAVTILNSTTAVTCITNFAGIFVDNHVAVHVDNHVGAHVDKHPGFHIDLHEGVHLATEDLHTGTITTADVQSWLGAHAHVATSWNHIVASTHYSMASVTVQL